jgi:hypothetical protein
LSAGDVDADEAGGQHRRRRQREVKATLQVERAALPPSATVVTAARQGGPPLGQVDVCCGRSVRISAWDAADRRPAGGQVVEAGDMDLARSAELGEPPPSATPAEQIGPSAVVVLLQILDARVPGGRWRPRPLGQRSWMPLLWHLSAAVRAWSPDLGAKTPP